MIPTPRLALWLAALAPLAVLAWRWPAAWPLVAIADAVVLVLYVLASRDAARKRETTVRREASGYLSVDREAMLTLTVEPRGDGGGRLEVHDHLPPTFEPRDLSQARAWPAGPLAIARPVRPTRRGRFAAAPPVALVTGKLGLTWTHARGVAGSELRVLPDLRPLGRFDTLVRQARLREMGIVRARARGEGHDLAGLRAYAPGDPFQRIHWKATARRGKPIVREYETERQQPVLLLLDAGRRMARESDGRSRLDEAIDAALLLTHVALSHDDRVGLWAFADAPLRRIAPARGRGQEKLVARALFDLEPVLREPSYAALAAKVRAAETRRSLVVLFTDVLDPGSLKQLMAPVRLLGQRHLCLLVIFKDTSLEANLLASPRDGEALYLAGAAANLGRERETGLAALRRAGALVLEAPPGALASAVVNRYLEIKARGLL